MDEFEANPGGNKKYFDFIKAMAIECKEVEMPIADGKTKKVFELPSELNDFEVLGAPVIATVNFGKEWKGSDGVPRQSLEVKHLDKWEGGVKIDVESDEMPF